MPDPHDMLRALVLCIVGPPVIAAGYCFGVLSALPRRALRALGYEVLTTDQARELRTALVQLDDGHLGVDTALRHGCGLYDDQAVCGAHKALSNVLRHDLPDGEAELRRTRAWMYPASDGAPGDPDPDMPF